MTQEKLTYLISCTLPSGSVIHGRIKLYLIWIFFRAFYGLYANIFAFTVVGLTSYPYLIKEGRKMLSFSGAALFLGCEITVKCSEAGDALSPSVNTDWSSNFPATSRGPEFVDLQWRQLGICIFFENSCLADVAGAWTILLRQTSLNFGENKLWSECCIHRLGKEPGLFMSILFTAALTCGDLNSSCKEHKISTTGP